LMIRIFYFWGTCNWRLDIKSTGKSGKEIAFRA